MRELDGMEAMASIKRKAFTGVILFLVLFISILILTLPTSSVLDKNLSHDKTSALIMDGTEIRSRLSKAIQFETVSSSLNTQKTQKMFHSFNAFLENNYPLVYQYLKVEKVSDYSLLYRWRAKDDNKLPALLIAHTDVVPAIQKNINHPDKEWSYNPYSGFDNDEFIWGRGTLDNKSMVLAILESIEKSLRNGRLTPNRTVYVAVTHDEEIGGHKGAKIIADLMQSRNIKLAFILDEGQAITHKIVPGVASPVAMIGVSQKGYMTLKLSVSGKGGHSMMPPRATAISVLSQAISKLTDAPMPSKLTEPVREMFSSLSPEMTFPNNIFLHHTWLTGPIVKSQLSKKPATDALIRSSMSFNMIEGGIAENVLPQSASVVVNFRIAAHNTSDDIIQYLSKTIADKRVKIEVISSIEEASPITDVDSVSYKMVEKAIQNVFPKVAIAPSITLSTTDSRHFYALSDEILRFSPIRIGEKDLSRFHGVDERISISNYFEMIDFYSSLFDHI